MLHICSYVYTIGSSSVEDMWDEYIKSNWKDEPPVYISQELQDLIKDHPDFFATLIGPVGNCIVSEQLRNLIPESLVHLTL